MANATRNQPITIQISHDQVDTTQYVLIQDGTDVATKPVDPAGVNFQFPTGFAAGSYTFAVRAEGPGGTSTSDPVQLIVAPGAPNQPVIVIVVG